MDGCLKMSAELQLHTFVEGNRTARVYTRGKNSYRVFVLDSYTEFQDEKYFDSEEDAEVFAEDWVLKNE